MAPLLEATGIVKRFHHGMWPVRQTLSVLDGADLTIDRGELVGLVGENGSGKSTLMKIAVGLLGNDGGTIVRHGRSGDRPQQALLWDKLTVTEHFHLFGRAYSMPEAESLVAREELLDELDFSGDMPTSAWRISPAGLGRSSTWRSRSCTIRSSSCWTSRTPASTGRPAERVRPSAGGWKLGDRAIALGAGWGVAFVAGALAYFALESSRGRTGDWRLPDPVRCGSPARGSSRRLHSARSWSRRHSSRSGCTPGSLLASSLPSAASC